MSAEYLTATVLNNSKMYLVHCSCRQVEVSKGRGSDDFYLATKIRRERILEKSKSEKH